jgi:phage terminase Nu1 subunit (DNA packaging protein)
VSISSEGGYPETVTKSAMARICGVALPTFEAWLGKWGDQFPIEARGARGLGWKFSPPKVLAFLAEHRDAATGAMRSPGAAGTGAQSVAARIQAERLRKLELENRQAEGELVRADMVLDLLGTTFADLSRGLRDFLRQIARENGWPDAILNTNESRLAELQRGMVDRLAGSLGQRAPDDQRSSGA